MNQLDPFNRGTKNKMPFRPEVNKTEVQPEEDSAPGFVVRRKEDQKYLGFDGKPTSDISEAEPHDSRSVAGIWAERATRERPGTWEAVPHPGAGDPDDDDPSSLSDTRALLSKRAA